MSNNFNQYKLKLISEKTREEFVSDYPLIDYLCENKQVTHIFIKGQRGIGKSYQIQNAFNTLQEKKIIDCVFYELKYYPQTTITLKNSDTLNLCFLDGLDEISEENKVKLTKVLAGKKNEYPNTRFIISGRDISFTEDISNVFSSNCDVLELYPYTEDPSLLALKEKYKNSPINGFVAVPLYRHFLENHSEEKYLSIKKFYNAFIEENLLSDKRKYDFSENITVLNHKSSEINIESIKKKLGKFCFTLFQKQIYVFLKDELDIFSEKEQIFLLKSDIIICKDNLYSFRLDFFYIYFIGMFLSRRSIFTLNRIFFIDKKKDISVRNLPLLEITLSLLGRKSNRYNKLFNTLKTISPAHILLADFNDFSESERYAAYENIIAHYNDKGKIIYYGKVQHTNDMVENIPSLSKKLFELLSEDYYDDALNKRIDFISNFLQSPKKEFLFAFANEIIMLGVNENRIWKDSQLEKLFSVLPNVLFFFVNSYLAANISGLLAYRSILLLYKTYNRTENWSDNNWNGFLKDILGKAVIYDTEIKSDKEFYLKANLFCIFNDSTIIQKMLIPLCVYLFENNRKEKPMMETVPQTLDDTYNSPSVEIFDDLFFLDYTLQRYEFSLEEMIGIFKICADKKLDLHYNSWQSASRILRTLLNNFNEIVKDLTSEKYDDLYLILCYFTDNNICDNSYSFLEKLPDDAKIYILEKLKKEITLNSRGYKWTYINLIFELFRLHNKETAVEILNKFNIPELQGIFMDIVYQAMRDTEYPLYAAAKAIHKSSPLFERDRQLQKYKNNLLTTFEKNKDEILKKEDDIITDKSTLVSEINAIFAFIDDENNNAYYQNEVGENDTPVTERWKLLHLKLEQIETAIKNDYKMVYVLPRIFSPFVIDWLFDLSFNDDKRVDRKSLFSYIDTTFASEERYWLFIFNTKINQMNNEDAKSFFEKNVIIKNRVLASLQKNMIFLSSNYDVEAYINRSVRNFIVPFIRYLSLFKNSEIFSNGLVPDFLYNLLFFPVIELNRGFQMGSDFRYGEYEDIADFLKQKFGYSIESLLKYTLENYEKCSAENYVKAQILDFLLKNRENNLYKQKIEEIIFKENKAELEKNYKDDNFSQENSVLAKYWRELIPKEDDVNKAISLINTTVLDFYVEDSNYLAKELVNFVNRNASVKQKKQLIKKYRKQRAVPEIAAFLCLLGEEKQVVLEINHYLKGMYIKKSVPYELLPIGYLKPSRKMLRKFVHLYDYSLGNQSYRRRMLYNTACNGIKNHTTKYNFSTFRKLFNKIIKKRKKNNEYTETIENFYNEIKQRVFDKRFETHNKILNTMFVIGLLLTVVLLFVKTKKIIPISTGLFTLITGMASLLPFMGITNYKELLLIIKTKLLRLEN